MTDTTANANPSLRSADLLRERHAQEKQGLDSVVASHPCGRKKGRKDGTRVGSVVRARDRLSVPAGKRLGERYGMHD
jgi:hypothetical protein